MLRLEKCVCLASPLASLLSMFLVRQDFAILRLVSLARLTFLLLLGFAYSGSWQMRIFVGCWACRNTVANRKGACNNVVNLVVESSFRLTVLRSETPPNTACSWRWVRAAFFRRLSGWKLVPFRQRISPRHPPQLMPTVGQSALTMKSSLNDRKKHLRGLESGKI